MDTLAAFAFGIIIINAIKDKGITSRKEVLGFCTESRLNSCHFVGDRLYVFNLCRGNKCGKTGSTG